ncbi:TonB-dependent receptor [Prevotella sp. E13-17]|uniref:TonB-dependent receptor n=1 Tax=Prevotella sp. E13-17 TaxID=2913616 RepID=UPI001EDB9A20|nr:TonB-dependent receptor [Prevotella sp. E13-17]UKK52339.1 TonB-dependent receptor [Prevotella sp. E13-17]
MAVSTAMMAQTDTLALQEVVVTGTRQPTDVRHLPMTVTVIDRQTLTQNQQQNVLPTVAQHVPGMFVTSRGVMGYGVSGGAAGGISVRGLSGSVGQMLVLVDGHPQYNGVYGHPISDSYQTMMAERVEVLRGPASVLYGNNAMGGVINIVTRGMHHDGVRTTVNLGAGSYGSVQAEVANQLRSGRFGSTVAAQYSRSDNHRPNMGFEQYGGYVKLAYDLNDHWDVYADLDLTHFNASNPGSTDKLKLEADQYITRGVASLVLENHFANTSGALSIYDNFGRHKINDGYDAVGGTPQSDYFRSKDAVAGASWYQTMRLFRGNRLTVGADYQHIYGRAYYTNRITGDVNMAGKRKMQSAHAHENEVAGYVDFRQDLSAYVTVDVGLRYDHHSQAGGEWVPQVGLVHRSLEGGELKLSVAKGFRNPNAKDMYLYGTANDQLEAERLWNYELSWRKRVGNFRYGVNVFYAKGDNLIQTVAGKNINTGEIENCGAELEADLRLNEHWSFNTNHSLLHMENKVIAAPTYKGFMGANYHQSKWTVTAGLQYLDHLYTAVGANEQSENVMLLNATVNYALTKDVALWLRGENLLAQSYELNAGFPMPRATFMAGVNIAF